MSLILRMEKVTNRVKVVSSLVAVALGCGTIISPLAKRVLAAPVPMRPQAVGHKLSDYTVPKLDDFETVMKAVFHDDNAARKINKDIGMIYQLKGDVRIRYKEENKFRADGQLGASRATLIINDAKQLYTVVGVRQVSNLGKAPGKRKSLLDMGLISDYYLTYAQGEFVGERTYDGVNCAVFRITYKDRSLDTSHRIVWIDPKTKVTLKREEYGQDTEKGAGKLRSIWLYKEPREVVPGVYFPSRIELYNAENQKAGETAYTNTKVNVGLNDDVFKL